MIDENISVVIDVGTNKVCTIIAERLNDKRINVIGIGVAVNDGMAHGLIKDPRLVANAIKDSNKRATIDTGLVIKKAILGIAGSNVRSMHCWDSIQKVEGIAAVTATDLNNGIESSKITSNQDWQTLHVIPRTYSLDGTRGIRNPLGMHADELKMEVTKIIGNPEQIGRLEDVVDMSGTKALAVIATPICTAEAVLTSDECEDGVILMDIGGGTTDISVFHEGSVIYTSSVPVGGNHFTNDLSIAFSIGPDEAERLKIEKGTCVPEITPISEEITLNPINLPDPIVLTRREIGQVLKDRAEELLRMSLLRLDVDLLKDLPIERVVFTGGGAKMEGFLQLANYMLQRKTRLGKPRGVEKLPEFNIDPSYASAVGLTIWGINNLSLEGCVSEKHSSFRAGKLIGWLPGRE